MIGGRLQTLIGVILQAEGHLSEAQADIVLAEQNRLRYGDQFVPFGQVAVQLGIVDQAHVDWALELQERVSVASEERKRLGYFLLDSGVVKPRALWEALEAQRTGGGMLGDRLVQAGAIAPGQLAAILDRQEWQDRYENLG